jgi:hypothetical protein
MPRRLPPQPPGAELLRCYCGEEVAVFHKECLALADADLPCRGDAHWVELDLAYGKGGYRRYRCVDCSAVFTEAPLGLRE